MKQQTNDITEGPLRLANNIPPEALKALARLENILRKRAERRGFRLRKCRQKSLHAFWLIEASTGECVYGGDEGANLDEIERQLYAEDIIDDLIALGCIGIVGPEPTPEQIEFYRRRRPHAERRAIEDGGIR